MTYFRQIYDEGLAQASYLIGDPKTRQMVVVDPLRDIDLYLDRAADAGYEIAGVAETHIHADFLSGGRELAHATGATFYISGETVSDWEYGALEGLEVVALHDGESFEMGDIEITALHTPGHTPEHVSFLVADNSDGGEPMAVLTGDFVFAGDLGRPDLLEEAAGQKGTAEPGAKETFETMNSGFLELPDFVAVWPGHGSGSACGKALGDVPASSIGYEKRTAWWTDYFEEGDEEGFVDEFLSDQPESPAYYKNMKLMNRDGAPILGELPSPPRLMPNRFQQLNEQPDTMVLDLRDLRTFARGHVPGSINLAVLKQISNHAGRLAPYDKTLVLVADPEDVEEATRRLIRIGLDDIAGYVPASRIGTYAEQLNSYPVIDDPDEARKLWDTEQVQVVDVRSQSEWEGGRVPGAHHIYYGRLPEKLPAARERGDLDEQQTLIVHCEAGARAAIGASFLEANDFEDVVIYTGGFGGWKKAGHPVEK